jgi:hypothetical protein
MFYALIASFWRSYIAAVRESFSEASLDEGAIW